MSQDFQIAFPCSHRAVLEPVKLLSDRRVLNTSVGVVAVEQVRMNGTVVPPEGLLTAAKITSGKVAPFRFYADATEMTVKLAGGSYTINFPAGLQYTEAVLRALNVSESFTASVQDGRIVLVDNVHRGPGSRISISGPAVESLGFSQGAGASGREVCPGWSVAKVPGGSQKPVLFIPSKFTDSARWEVTYIMDPNQCRRCMSSRIENDLRFRSNGEPALVTGENLLHQMVMKAVLTIKRSNKYHRWYGSSVMDSIGLKNAGAAVGSIKAELRSCIQRMIALQSEQEKYQNVSRSERIVDVIAINCKAHQNDPTTLLVDIAVRNASYRPVSISVVFSVPGASATLRRDGSIVARLSNKSGG